MISFAKVKINTASYLFSLENWKLSVVHKIREYQSGKCADFLRCCLSLCHPSEAPLGGVVVGLISIYLGWFFPLLCLEKLNDVGNVFSMLPLAGPWFKLDWYVPLFPLHMLHGSLLITFPSCYLLCTALLLLCRFPAPSWVAREQLGSQDEGTAPAITAPSDFISAVKGEDNKPSTASKQFI